MTDGVNLDDGVKLSAQLDPAARKQALLAIYVSSFLAGLAIGAAMPLISMAMEFRGMSASSIGYVVAAAPLALLCTSPFIGRMVSTFGLVGSMLLGILIIVVTFLAMPHWFGVTEWFVLRLIAGVGVASIWILSETWVNALATRETRGRIIATFMIIMTAGFGMGPLIIEVIGVDSWLPFYVAAGLISISAIPLFRARHVAPNLPQAPAWSFARAFRMAPVVMATAVLAGVTDSAQISFFPVYSIRMGHSAEIALFMLMAIILGNIVIQIPIGIYSDRIDRNKLLVACLVTCCITGGLVPFVLHMPWVIWPVLALWGGAAFALYTIALIILGDRFKPAELAGANAAFVAVFEIGSISGPVTVGHAMDLWGPNGMPIVLVASSIPLVIFALWRRLTRRVVAP